MDRVKEWADRETLTHTALNAEFDNIINNEDLVDAVTKKHAATLIGTKTIDETDIANSKVITYNSTSGNLEYESAGTPDAHAATHVTGGGDTIANVIAAGNAGLMTGADKTKLNGIEAAADVTDATNVNAAGAVMTTDTVNVISDITSTGANIEDAVTKKHAANTDTALGAQSENLNMNTHKIVGVVDPTADQDVETKKHVADNYALKGANADITSMTALTQITRATGGAFNIAIGSAAGDDFTVDTNKLVVEGDTGLVKIGSNASNFVFKPNSSLTVPVGGSTLASVITTSGNSASAYHVGFEIPANDIYDGFFITTDSDQDGVPDVVALRILANGNIGVNTTIPGGKLCINGGVTVGSDTDAGDNNLRVEGTVNIIGQLNMNTQKIVGVVDPTEDQDVATKKFVIDNSGVLTWSVISANTNAVTGHGYFINASEGSVTLTLPASPNIGNTIAVCDSYNKATTNTITIARNTKNIEGTAENLVININGAGFTMVYSDVTRGWEIVTEI